MGRVCKAISQRGLYLHGLGLWGGCMNEIQVQTRQLLQSHRQAPPTSTILCHVRWMRSCTSKAALIIPCT